MMRHKVSLYLYLADDDQSDDEAVKDQVEYWVRAAIDKDMEDNGTEQWPVKWQVAHAGSHYVRNNPATTTIKRRIPNERTAGQAEGTEGPQVHPAAGE